MYWHLFMCAVLRSGPTGAAKLCKGPKGSRRQAACRSAGLRGRILPCNLSYSGVYFPHRQKGHQRQTAGGVQVKRWVTLVRNLWPLMPRLHRQALAERVCGQTKMGPERWGKNAFSRFIPPDPASQACTGPLGGLQVLRPCLTHQEAQGAASEQS